MMDWPVMNANQHAMPLIGLIRVAGIEPGLGGNGLRIHPAPLPTGEPVTVDLPLLRLTFDDRSIQGVYRARVTGSTELQIHVPEGATQARVNGAAVPIVGGSDSLRVLLTFNAGDEIPFSIGP